MFSHAVLAVIFFLAAPPIMADNLSNNLGLGGGLGLSVRPDYLGSNSYEVRPIPLVEARWRDRIRLSTREEELVVNILGDGPTIGARFSYWEGREAGDNPAVADLEDYSRNLTGGLFVLYNQGPLSTELQVDQDLGGDRQGTTASVSVTFRTVLTNDLRMRFGSYLTWASEDYMDAMFSIRDFEAARSPLYDDGYSADAGFRDLRLDILMDYSLGRNWSLIGRLDYAYLLGDAADSPLVDKQGSRSQILTSIGAIYLW